MRELAIQALRDQIALATGVKSTTRETDRDLIPATGMPCVIIPDNGAERIEYKTGGRADVYLTLDLEILTDKPTGQSTSLNALDVAIKRKLGENPTLGGTVAHLTILPQIGGDTPGSDGVASRKRQVRFFYDCLTSEGL